MTTLAFTRTGAGDPLVLLHGLGSSRAAWDPVVPALAEQFDVIAVDLPGFGDSAPLPPQVEPVPGVIARAISQFLDEHRLVRPHIAGNSLGGWVALELAQLRPVASVTLLSPAGLWRNDTPLYSRASLRTTRWLCRHAEAPLNRVVNSRLGRSLVLSQVFGRPARMTADHARASIRAMGRGPGFDAALRATTRRRYQGGRPIEVPVSIAFGSRDRILLKRQSRHLAELPRDTHVATLPGCGHVPMSDDPGAVAALITSTTARGAVAQATTPAE